MLPSTCLWSHAHTCCQEEVIRAIAGDSCSVSLQKLGSAPRPWTKAIFLILVVFMCKQAPGPGLGRSHRAAWSLGSPDTIHASAWAGSQNGEDGLVSFWGVGVKKGCAVFSGALVICKPRRGQQPFGCGTYLKGFVSDDLSHPWT